MSAWNLSDSRAYKPLIKKPYHTVRNIVALRGHIITLLFTVSNSLIIQVSETPVNIMDSPILHFIAQSIIFSLV